MAQKKAAGHDGYVAEVYQHLPCLVSPIKELFNVILQTGCLPLDMLKLVIVLLDKPNRDPELCKSKRPIALIPILSKILEAAVLHRIMEQLEGSLEQKQYAYRRQRGTEAQLLEFHDFAREALGSGHCVYAASVDVDSAFDNVPRDSLVRTAEKMGVVPSFAVISEPGSPGGSSLSGSELQKGAGLAIGGELGVASHKVAFRHPSYG